MAVRDGGRRIVQAIDGASVKRNVPEPEQGGYPRGDDDATGRWTPPDTE